MAEDGREASTCRGATVPSHVMEAIYGKGVFQASDGGGGAGEGAGGEGQAGGPSTSSKEAQYESSLRRWWSDYAARKEDDDDEHHSNSLLYDKNTLPRSAPAPVFRDGTSAATPLRGERPS